MDFRQNNDGSFYKTYCIMKISFDENPWFVDWLGIDFLKNDLLMWICARPCPPLSAGSGAQCRDRSVCNSYMSMCTDVDIHICIYIYIYRERERCMYTHVLPRRPLHEEALVRAAAAAGGDLWSLLITTMRITITSTTIMVIIISVITIIIKRDK